MGDKGAAHRRLSSLQAFQNNTPVMSLSVFLSFVLFFVFLTIRVFRCSKEEIQEEDEGVSGLLDRCGDLRGHMGLCLHVS